MSKDPTSRPDPTLFDPMLFAEDSLASHFPTQESNELKTTPATSGRKCSDLSGNAGPLGLLEKTLLGSSNWAWTKYSLTWKTKATPQGRLIFQLARLAPRTSGSDSGLLHTPTAKANQMAPSMATSGSGNWVSTLWPTPRTTGLDGGSNSRKAAKARGMWPTPTQDSATERTKEYSQGGTPLTLAVQMFPTPDVGAAKGRGQKSAAERHRLGGSLNPMWVAWLMGYPIEYLSCVPWETRSSRKSRKK